MSSLKIKHFRPVKVPTDSIFVCKWQKVKVEKIFKLFCEVCKKRLYIFVTPL